MRFDNPKSVRIMQRISPVHFMETPHVPKEKLGEDYIGCGYGAGITPLAAECLVIGEPMKRLK